MGGVGETPVVGGAEDGVKIDSAIVSNALSSRPSKVFTSTIWDDPSLLVDGDAAEDSEGVISERGEGLGE